MRITTLLFLILFFHIGLFAFAQTNPPKISATGNQIYCAGTNIKIVTSATITHDAADTGTDAIYIQISSGYISGPDLLTLANPASHPNITTNWSASEGKLKLYSPTGILENYIDLENAIRDVEYNNSSLSPSGTRSFSINLGFGSANYLPRNGHFYEFVPSLDITWINAKADAANRPYYGLQGYLATLTAEDEALLAGAQAPGTGWIGGTDAETEGVWKWVTGPEGLNNGGTGTIFWNGDFSGSTPNFARWNTNSAYKEPNNAGGTEHYAHITNPNLVGSIKGAWNDLENTGGPGLYRPQGYIVEYGGMPGESPLEISASTTITIPAIVSINSAARCGEGTLTLTAAATDGDVLWYNSKTGGPLIAIGDSYTTPSISTTTSYYVNVANEICDTPRREIIATVKPFPTITATTPGIVCNSGAATLEAVASAGIINWYDVPNGGTLKGTGTKFTTPSISTSTTYYVEALADDCTSTSRTAVTATVTISLTITSTIPEERCGDGTVTLKATASSGDINWYDSASAGTLLYSGNAFTTPIISATTTFYAEAVVNGCSSTRVGVLATVYPINTIKQEIILCQGESVTLNASIENMNYLWSPGGETTRNITVSAIGDYSVTISSPNAIACESKKIISVIEQPKPVINVINVIENSITIELEKSQQYYEYSINGLDFQPLNQFSYLQSGSYVAYVRDVNGCNLVEQGFIVFTISKFFTPNNDGANDTWEIKEMINYPQSIAQVFDRFGKLIIELNAKNYSWNGTYENKYLPADDYWYRIKLENNKPEIKGHFTLKR
jgi:gliding motility-associated-like protein